MVAKPVSLGAEGVYISEVTTMKNFGVAVLVFLYGMGILLFGCGRDTGSNNASGNERSGYAPTQEVPDSATEGSFYAATESDLPECNQKTQGRLVYVGSTDSFKACQSGGYVAVSIKGKDGKDGASGKDATSVEQNEWIDGLTGKKWVMGYQGTQPQSTTDCAAIGTYRTPSLTELQSACIHGLFKVYQTKMGSLPTTVSWAFGSGDIVTISSCAAGSQATGVPAVIVCIQK